MNDESSIPSPNPGDDPPLGPMGPCFVFFNVELRANANRRKRVRERFVRAGFDIDKKRASMNSKQHWKGSWHIVCSEMPLGFEQRSEERMTLDQ